MPLYLALFVWQFWLEICQPSLGVIIPLKKKIKQIFIVRLIVFVLSVFLVITLSPPAVLGITGIILADIIGTVTESTLLFLSVMSDDRRVFNRRFGRRIGLMVAVGITTAVISWAILQFLPWSPDQSHLVLIWKMGVLGLTITTVYCSISWWMGLTEFDRVKTYALSFFRSK